ncbi:MAG: tetratricopeptide repeat protein [Acidobacteria bacterium]|nr:tetratricopeptide repeat protein [Acidobacteriota bacterium]
MKIRVSYPLVLTLLFTSTHIFAFSSDASSRAKLQLFQQGPGRGPIAAPRDLELEKQCEKSLDAAKYYFYKRKPDKNDKAGWDRINKAIEGRLQEIIDTNPTFARIDNVFFLLGELYQRSGDLEKAMENWTIVVKEYPDSELKSQAQKRLNETQNQSKEKKG